MKLLKTLPKGDGNCLSGLLLFLLTVVNLFVSTCEIYAVRDDSVYLNFVDYYDDPDGCATVVLRSVSAIPADGVLYVPDYIKGYNDEKLRVVGIESLGIDNPDGKLLKKIVLPATLRDLGCAPGYPNYFNKALLQNYVKYGLEAVEVDPANPYYKVEDGLLLTKDGKEVCFISKAFEDQDVVCYPEGVERICPRDYTTCYHHYNVEQGGFVYGKGHNVGRHKTVVFPSTIKEITDVFHYFDHIVFRSQDPPEVTTSYATGYTMPYYFYYETSDEEYRSGSPYMVYVPKGSIDKYKLTIWEELYPKKRMKEFAFGGKKKVKITPEFGQSTVKSIKINGKECKNNEYMADTYETLVLEVEGCPDPEYFHDFAARESSYVYGDGKMIYKFVATDDTEIKFGCGEGRDIGKFFFRTTYDGVAVWPSGEMNDADCKNLVIPSTAEINGIVYDVTEVHESAFGGRPIEKLTLPSTIKRIGNYAFEGSYEEIYDPVTDEYKGIECHGKLKEIKFAQGLETIGLKAFAHHPDLKEVILPESLVEMNGTAFNDARLKKLYLPGSLEFCVDRYRNDSWDGRLETLVIGASESLLKCRLPEARTIEIHRPWMCQEADQAVCENLIFDCQKGFLDLTGIKTRGASGVKKIEIKGGDVEIIGSVDYLNNIDGMSTSSFQWDYMSLQELSIDCKSVSIGNDAFASCANIKNLTIATDGGSRIGYGAFENCTGIKDVKMSGIEDGMKIFTFAGCKSLQSINIPGDVRYINSTAFKGNVALQKVTFDPGPANLYITTESFGDAKIKEVRLDRNIIGIEPAFFRCETLEKIEIGPNIHRIPDFMFADCKNLKGIYCDSEIPPSISENTFRGVPTDKCKVYVKGNNGLYKEAGGWKEFFPVISVEEVKETLPVITGTPQGIHIENAAGRSVGVYAISGQEIYYSMAEIDSIDISVQKGIYIVIVGDKAYKFFYK